MSSIDRRVVEMQFDNSQFDKGVRDTLVALDLLKKGLQLEDSKRSIRDLQEAGRGFNLNSMKDALDNISDKFSVMGAVGFAVIQRLTNAAIDFAKRTAGLVWDPLVAGGRRRAMNIEQARFQFRGLGIDAEAAMQDALYAVQGTAFGLDEAARAAAQLSASQVSLGDDMKGALRGISGVAAMTNSSYEDISRIFTRVAGQGRVMAVDLNSIAARGLNAAATLAESLGVTEAEIREMTSRGEISFAMFAEAMDNAFGENATKANETYSGSLANLRAALARIGARFFTHWLEQQRDLFNALAPAVDNVGRALAPVIDLFAAFTRQRTNALINSINNINFDAVGMMIMRMSAILRNTIRALMSIINPIRQAFTDIFPPATAEQIDSIMLRLQAFTAGLKMGADGAENLRRTFAGVFAVFSIGWTIIKNVAMVFADLFGVAFSGSGGFLEATASIGDFLVALDQAVKNGTGVTKFFEGLGNVLRVPVQLIRDLASAIFELFTFEPPSSEGIARTFEPLTRLGEIMTKVWEGALNVLRAVWRVFKPLADLLSPIFAEIGGVISQFMQDLDFDTAVRSIQTGLLGGILVTFRRFTREMGTSVGGSVNRMTGPFAALTRTLTVMQGTLRAMTLMQIAAAVGILALSVVSLSKIDAAGLARAMSAISGMMFQLVAMLTAFQRIGGTPGLITTGIGLIALATALRILTSSIKALAELEWDELSRGLSGVTILLGALVLAVQGMSGHTSGMMRAGIGLMFLSAGIKILASAVTDLSGLGWEDMARGLVGVGSLLAALAIFTHMVSVNSAGITQSAGLVLLATAIKILASAVADFAELSWEDVARGLVSVTAILAAFAGFSQIMNPSGMLRSGAALILIATAMNILASAVAAFGSMSWDEIGRGLFTMAQALAAVIAALWLMPPSTLASAAALLVVAAALNVLATALQSMGGMSWEEIGRGLATLGGSLLIISVAMLAMKTALPGAAALLIIAGALAILAPVLLIFGSMSISEIAMSLGMLVGVFLVLGIAGMGLAPVVPVLMGLGVAVGLLGIGLLAAGAGVLMFSMGLTALAASAGAAVAVIIGTVAGLLGLLPMAAEQLALALIIFIEIVAQSGPAMLEAMTAILAAVIGAIEANVPDIIQLIGDMALELVEKLREIIPPMARAALEMMLGVLEAMLDNVPSIVRVIINLVIAILEELAAGIPRFVEAATALMVAFLQGIADNIGDIIEAGANIIISFIEGIASNAVRITEAAFEAIITFVDGVAAAIETHSEALREAGGRLARAIADGLTGGLFSRASDVANAAGDVARGALSRAANVLGIRSPSREFHKLGVWINEGFIDGLVAGQDSVISTWTTTQDMLSKAMDDAAEDIVRHSNRLEQLTSARHRDTEAIKETRAELRLSVDEYQRAEAALALLNDEHASSGEMLNNLGHEYDLYSEQLAEANKELEELINKQERLRDSLKKQFSQLPRLTQDTTVSDYTQGLEESIDELNEFYELIMFARELGLSDELYEEFLQAGTAIIPFLRELTEGGEESVQIINDLSAELGETAREMGIYLSEELYQTGVDAMEGLINGLESQLDRVRELMSEIAATIRNGLNDELDIRSPSRVLYKIGEYTIAGFINGIEDTAKQLDATASGVANDTINTLKTTMSSLNDILESTVDFNPTITPVLDLTAFEQKASEIGSIFENPQIDLSTSKGQAAMASRNYNLATVDTTAEGYESAAANSVVFNQYNQSPKALSSAEIYRQTKNQLSVMKGALTPNVVNDD